MGIFWILEIVGGLSRGDVPKDDSGKSNTCTYEPGWYRIQLKYQYKTTDNNVII